MAKKASEPKIKEPDNEFKWKLNNLERQLKEVHKALK
jgi:hypothetical protein